MKIAVLASGGVDSSVALKLLKDQGHELTAFYLKIWLEDELAFLGSCPWEEDLAYLRKICADLDIPLEIIPMQKEYWDEVVNYALAEVKAGRTPNSDMMCNAKVKFGKFYERIDASFEKVATGHYANVEEKDGLFFLKKAKDTFKDQTYFLAHLKQEQLERAIFPLGNFLKAEVRELAQKFNLPNQNRKDSQGICFLGKIKYTEFIKYHLGEQEGDFIEFETGRKIGKHHGYWYYTIGQRQGIGLSGGPWFVVQKDLEKNLVYISNHYHAQDKIRNHFIVKNFNWIAANPFNSTEKSLHLGVKIRHGERIYPANLTIKNSKELKVFNKNEAEVSIEGSDQGFAAGQFAVFYDESYCLGCAVIQ